MRKAKAKTPMPKDIKTKCSAAIHSATVAATAAGAIPIPVADTIPISAAQVAMVISLGKIFDITISNSVAKSVVGVGLAQNVGRAAVSGLKAIPVVGIFVGGFLSAATAAAITETLGWLVADDFYRMSVGQEPENITEAVRDLNDFQKETFTSKKKY